MVNCGEYLILEMAMQSEKLFDQAVQIAAGFVANGDIRLSGSTREDSMAMDQLADLIPSLCLMLREARQNSVARDSE